MNRNNEKNNVSWRAMFYGLFAIVQVALVGISGWSLAELIYQGKQIARIEEHLNIQAVRAPAPSAVVLKTTPEVDP